MKVCVSERERVCVCLERRRHRRMEGEELWVLLSLWRFFYALVFEIGVVAICFNGNKKSEEKKIVVVVVENWHVPMELH